VKNYKNFWTIRLEEFLDKIDLDILNNYTWKLFRQMDLRILERSDLNLDKLGLDTLSRVRVLREL